MADEFEYGNFLIAIVHIDGTPVKYEAQIFRKDHRRFSFKTEFGVGAHTHHRVSVMNTGPVDSEAEALHAGRNLADACETAD